MKKLFALAWFFVASLIVWLVELLTFKIIRGQHNLYKKAPSLRWWYTGTKHYQHGGWIFLSRRWFQRFGNMSDGWGGKLFVSSLALVFALCSIMIPMAGCAKVQQDLQTVLAKAPSVIAIVDTAIDLVNVIDPTAADPNLKATVNAIATEVVSDLNQLNQLITTYQSDLASAPPGALQQANGFVAAIDSQLASLTAAFHLKSAKAQAQAALIVDGVTLFLNELGSFLPASVAAQAGTAISAHTAQAAKKVKIVSAHTFAQNFNKSSAKNFPQIQIAVPK